MQFFHWKANHRGSVISLSKAFLENPQNGWSFFDIFRFPVWRLEPGALNEGGGSVLFLFYFIYYFIFSSVSPSLAKGCNVISELSWSTIRIHNYIIISLSYFLPVAEAAGFKPLNLCAWVNRSTNGTARFKNCKQSLEYQHLLLLRDILQAKF